MGLTESQIISLTPENQTVARHLELLNGTSSAIGDRLSNARDVELINQRLECDRNVNVALLRMNVDKRYHPAPGVHVTLAQGATPESLKGSRTLGSKALPHGSARKD
jgi:hypothetical protein